MKEIAQGQFDKVQAQNRKIELARLLVGVLESRGIKLKMSTAAFDAVLEYVDAHETVSPGKGCEVSCYDNLVARAKKAVDESRLGQDPLAELVFGLLGVNANLGQSPLEEMLVEHFVDPLLNVEDAFTDIAAGDSEALESLVTEAAGQGAKVLLRGGPEYALLEGLEHIEESDELSGCDVDLVQSALAYLADREVTLIFKGTNEAILHEALEQALRPEGDYSALQAMLKQNGLNIVKMPKPKAGVEAGA